MAYAKNWNLYVSNDDLLASIVNNADMAIVSVTLDGLISSWNPGARKVYGYEAREVVGKPWTVLMVPGKDQEAQSLLDRVLHGERIAHLVTSRVRKDGEEIYISLTIGPVRDGDGHVIGASAISRDVTEETSAHNELRNIALQAAARASAMDDLEISVRDQTDALNRLIHKTTTFVGADELDSRVHELELHEHRRRVRLVCWFFVLILGAGAFVYGLAAARVRANSHRIQQNCLILKDNRQVLRDLIDLSAAPTPIPSDVTPSLKQVIEDSNRRNDEFHAAAAKRLIAPDC